MKIGTLEIQLMADMAQLRKDMDDAKASVGGAMGGIESAVSAAKAAFIALGVVGGVNALAGMINGAIEGAAQLKDLSIATGASVESLSRFTEVGRTTGTTTDSIANMMNKLAKATTGTADETKGAGVAITALGLNFDTFKNMNPDDKLKAVAVAMNGFADGSDKSAAAMQLLGKSGAAALPFLQDLATTGEIVARVTTAQAAASDNFSDNLTVLKASGEAWKTELAMGMVPALDSAVTAFVDVTNGSGGLREEIRKLSADGSIANWTTNAIIGVTHVADAFVGFGRVVVSVGEVIGAWAAMVVQGFSSTFTAIGQAVTGNFGGAMETMKTMLTNQKNTVVDLGTKLSETWSEQTLGQKLRARMADMKDMGDASEATKPKLDVSAALKKSEDARKAEEAAIKAQEAAAKAHTAELKKQEEQYTKLIAGINEKTSAMEAEMNQGRALTEAQKAEVKLLADLESGTLKLTEKQRDNTLAAIANMGAVVDKYAAYKEDKKQTEENTKENEKYLTSLQNTTDALNKDTEKMRDNLTEMGLSKDELALLSAAKDIDRAATLERQAAVIIATAGETAQATEFKNQAIALRDLAALKEQGIHVRAAVEAQAAWARTTDSIGKGLSSALTDAVLNGKDIWLTFRDFMVKTIIDGYIKNALASVITDGLNSLIGGITGIKIGGSGGGSLLSTGANLGANAVTGGSGGVTGLLDSGVKAITGSTTGELLSAAGSALGITTSAAGGFAGTGAGAIGAAGGFAGTGAGAIGAAGGFAGTGAGAIGAAGGFAGTGSGVIGAAGAEAVGFLAAAGPVAALVAAFVVLNSLRSDDSGLSYHRNYNAAGIDVSPPSERGIGRRNEEYSAVTDSLAAQYVVLAKSLGITPAASMFGYMKASDGLINVSSNVNDVNYLAGWLPESSLDDMKTRAIVNALRGSTGDVGKLASISSMFPGFVGGGDFMGGIRIVGERGPEIEATGPSRIFDAATTASMLRSGGAGDPEVKAELRLIRIALDRANELAARTADATSGRQQSAPILVQVVPA